MTQITKPLPGATIDYGHHINRGLVGRWLINEGAGSRLADISGNGNHGTITNMDLTSAWTGSVHGGGLSFDGVDEFVRIPRDNSLNAFTSLTVVAFVNGPGTTSFLQVVSDYTTTGSQRSWKIQQNTTGDRLRVAVSDDGTATAGHVKLYLGSVGFEAFDDTWHQIGFTFDGPSSTLSLYVDGRPDPAPTKSSDDPITSLHNSTEDIRFGNRGDDVEHWEGSLSYVDIYDRALTELEMQQLNAEAFLGIL